MGIVGLQFTPPEALWEQVAQALRRAIILGELPPGYRVKEQALAARFGVSRVPIREAIVQLAYEGLIRSDPRHVATVVGFTEKDLADVYDCRRLLESHAMRRAAAVIDAQGVACLRALADRMQAAVAAGQMQQISAGDIEYHRQIMALSGNRILRNSWEPLAGLIGGILSIADVVAWDIARSVASHQTITQALHDHDAEQALSLLHTHLEEGEALMRRTLKEARNGTVRDDGR